MEETLISFETAKLAKEKGFNITNRNSYDELTGLMLPLDPYGHCYALEGVCPAPTQSLLQKWLREGHKIFIEIYMFDPARTDYFSTRVVRSLKYNVNLQYPYKSYEEALEAGLLEALKLINK